MRTLARIRSDEEFSEIFDEKMNSAMALGTINSPGKIYSLVCQVVDEIFANKPSLEDEVTRSLSAELLENEDYFELAYVFGDVEDESESSAQWDWKEILYPLFEEDFDPSDVYGRDGFVDWGAPEWEDIENRSEEEGEGGLKRMIDWFNRQIDFHLRRYWANEFVRADGRALARQFVWEFRDSVDQDEPGEPWTANRRRRESRISRRTAPAWIANKHQFEGGYEEIDNRSLGDPFELGYAEVERRLGVAPDAFFFVKRNAQYGEGGRASRWLDNFTRLWKELPIPSWIPPRIWFRALESAASDLGALTVGRRASSLESAYGQIEPSRIEKLVNDNLHEGCLIGSQSGVALDNSPRTLVVDIEKKPLSRTMQYLVPYQPAISEQVSDLVARRLDALLSSDEDRDQEFVDRIRGQFMSFVEKRRPTLFKKIKKSKLPSEAFDSHLHHFLSTKDPDEALQTLEETFGLMGYEGSAGEVLATVTKGELIGCGFKKGEKIYDQAPLRLVNLPPHELAYEGVTMRHCVGRPEYGYRQGVEEGRLQVWSLRTSANKPLLTWEVDVETAEATGFFYVKQVQGKANRSVPANLEEARLVAMVFVKVVDHISGYPAPGLERTDLLGSEALVRVLGGDGWSSVFHGLQSQALDAADVAPHSLNYEEVLELVANFWEDLVIDAWDCLGL